MIVSTLMYYMPNTCHFQVFSAAVVLWVPIHKSRPLSNTILVA